MKNAPRNIHLTALGLATAALISACGGGGSASSSSTIIAGAVIDGYISGATVCLDLNRDLVCNVGEPSAMSGANGAYSIEVPAATDLSGRSTMHLVVTVPTTARDSDAPTAPISVPYTMLAPADMPTVISPLTTAVSARMIIGGESLANARIGARSDLNLPVSYDFTKDHVATNDNPAHNVAKVVAAYLAVKVGVAAPNTANLTAALTLAKAGAAAAYASSNVTATVSGILGSPAPAPTPAPAPAPAPAGTSIVSFDEAALPTLGAFGDAAASIAVAPVGGTGAALKLDRTGLQNFGGTYFSVAAPIPFAATRKTVTARVYSTRANAVVYLKVETASGVFTEVSATVGAANTWQTLTWVLSGVDPANSYSTVVFSADTNVANSGAQTYWVDEVVLAPAAAPAPAPAPAPTPPPAATTPVVSTGFNLAGVLVNGGTWAAYAGSGGGAPTGSGGGYANDPTPANPSFEYIYTEGTLAQIGAYSYQGIGLTPSPTGTAVSAVGKASLGYSVAVNPEWFATSNGAKFVILIKSNVPGVSTATCDPSVAAVVQATASTAAAYATPLSAFTKVAQNCGNASVTAAQVLANRVIGVDFQADGLNSAITASGLTSNMNTTMLKAGTSVFPTTLNVVGAVQFQ